MGLTLITKTIWCTFDSIKYIGMEILQNYIEHIGQGQQYIGWWFTIHRTNFVTKKRNEVEQTRDKTKCARIRKEGIFELHQA